MNQLVEGLPLANSKELTIKENDCIAWTCNDEKTLEQAFALRHHVFAEELNWVPTSLDGLEKDKYDRFATHIVVTIGQYLAGYIRLIEGGLGNPFMLDKEFLPLNPTGESLNKKGHMEVTRVCTDPNLEARLKIKASLLLYKASYMYSIQNGINNWHIVVTGKYFRLLNYLGFPFKKEFSSYDFDPGSETVYASMENKKAQSIVRKSNPLMYRWMHETESQLQGEVVFRRQKVMQPS